MWTCTCIDLQVLYIGTKEGGCVQMYVILCCELEERDLIFGEIHREICHDYVL